MALQKAKNFMHNAPLFAEGTGSTMKGQAVDQGMEALMGGFILLIVAIYLVAEGRTILTNNEAALDSVDIALFGVVFIVLIAGIALWAWNSMME